MEARIPARLTPAEGRKFGLVVGSAFLLLGAVSHWRGHDVAPQVLWALGGSLVAAGVLIPGYLSPVHRGWMAFAQVLSKVTTPLAMGVIYFGLFTPMGIIRRLLGHNALIRPRGDTFWTTRKSGTRRSDLQRQF